MPKITITRVFQFDAGHRVPSHAGKCRSPHGHRYKVSVSLEGNVQKAGSGQEEGMIKDFAVLKALFGDWIEQNWDHAMLIYEKDTELRQKFEGSDWKFVLLPVIPTAEGLVEYLFTLFSAILAQNAFAAVKISEITLWETPNASATIKNDL